jgi:hypothetical protein
MQRMSIRKTVAKENVGRTDNSLAVLNHTKVEMWQIGAAMKALRQESLHKIADGRVKQQPSPVMPTTGMFR